MIPTAPLCSRMMLSYDFDIWFLSRVNRCISNSEYDYKGLPKGNIWRMRSSVLSNFTKGLKRPSKQVGSIAILNPKDNRQKPGLFPRWLHLSLQATSESGECSSKKLVIFELNSWRLRFWFVFASPDLTMTSWYPKLIWCKVLKRACEVEIIHSKYTSPIKYDMICSAQIQS